MKAARFGVEQWRSADRRPEVPVPETVKRAFAARWAAAVTDAAAHYQEDPDAASELVDAAAEEAGKPVDTRRQVPRRKNGRHRRGGSGGPDAGQLTEEATRHQGECRFGG